MRWGRGCVVLDIFDCAAERRGRMVRLRKSGEYMSNQIELLKDRTYLYTQTADVMLLMHVHYQKTSEPRSDD